MSGGLGATWEHRAGDRVSAPISWWGDYVISHRPGQHVVSYRPAGQHIPVGEFPTAAAAKKAALAHASRPSNPMLMRGHPRGNPKPSRGLRGIDDVTEADEAATSKNVALQNYREKLRHYRAGEETYGVLQMYHDAAISAGWHGPDLMRVQSQLQAEEVEQSLREQHGLRGVGDGTPLDDFEARDLLYQWHGGGGSGVYQVASMMDHGVPPGAYERARGELAYARRQEMERAASGKRRGQYTTGPSPVEELDALIAWLDGKIGGGLGGATDGGGPHGLPHPWDVKEVLGGGWMVTNGGIQWAPPGYPRWPDGSAELVFATRQGAIQAVKEYLRGLDPRAWGHGKYVKPWGGLGNSDEPDEPDEDDITTSDHHRWYQSGKIYFTGDEAGLRAKMEQDKFWPNVWFISDHGNAYQIEV